MDWCHYRFHSRWDLDAAPAAVFAALANGDDYPRWWPQVREVRRIDEHSGAARFRSLVPYDLRVTVSQARQDPADGVLEIGFSGDLEGWARWTVLPHGTGTRALFEQEVVARKPLLRRLALPGRPVFRANHALMMRSGRRGLRAHLAARPAGPASPPSGGHTV
ncbi:SRPBCC family protein [Streptomyces sp. NEAU-YJ-81]|uniref:SRPBCC family protein n=1 Tax=Streptomyces sp. NEAU-YJ-81 TaxID=2820288 RepID=UPI001ABCC6DF|nr:SRPBCC family protein [Streptomyces sp. NEAU-YJ-81]MBO3681006.1 SRPBCC family protein [Streptomyces sp. NEAU-YJ-81]